MVLLWCHDFTDFFRIQNHQLINHFINTELKVCVSFQTCKSVIAISSSVFSFKVLLYQLPTEFTVYITKKCVL